MSFSYERIIPCGSATVIRVNTKSMGIHLEGTHPKLSERCQMRKVLDSWHPIIADVKRGKVELFVFVVISPPVRVSFISLLVRKDS